jgi:hypothetical protein
MNKLNVLLAKTDSLAPQFKGMVNDFSKFFSKSQGAFLGEKRTYEPKEGTIDEPTKRGNILVQTTVDEKLEWFKANAKDYIDALFAQEATNASGNAKAELIVDGENWGTYTSLELLRLKSIVEANNLHGMLEAIPVRSDSEEWSESKNEMYADKNIFETPLITGVIKTTEKENYILKDPNVDHNSPNYTPTVGVKTTTVELGDYTQQRFSGQWTQRKRAEALKRRATLLTAIIETLKKCNEADVVNSELTSDKIFGYLFGNK